MSDAQTAAAPAAETPAPSRTSLHELIDWVDLFGLEVAEHGATLRRAIEAGHVRRPISDVDLILARLEPLRRLARLLRLIRAFTPKLPRDFVAAVENEADVGMGRR